jgi:hypothetical protein
MVQEFLQRTLLTIPPILMALTVHECAHAWVANRLGDPTAKMLGRVTLNPIRHLDPIGTLMLLFSGLFGWAKPVPINPRNFSNISRSIVLVSIAGPLSNLFLAALSALVYKLFEAAGPEFLSSMPTLWRPLFAMIELSIIINVALAVKEKEIQIAGANRDENIGKAEAERDTRVKMAEANAVAVQGENLSRIEIADSEAARREREAEALKRAIAAEKVQAAKALEQAYEAEKIAENARAERDRATQTATIVVAADIQKQKLIIEAKAAAEQLREKAKGEADAIFAKLEAEARGMYEILTKQAEGLERIVKSAGNDPKDAVLLLIVDKLPELVRMQSEAIKNIKIDKVTVWDGGGGQGDGNSTAHFMSIPTPSRSRVWKGFFGRIPCST